MKRILAMIFAALALSVAAAGAGTGIASSEGQKPLFRRCSDEEDLGGGGPGAAREPRHGSGGLDCTRGRHGAPLGGPAAAGLEGPVWLGGARCASIAVS